MTALLSALEQGNDGVGGDPKFPSHASQRCALLAEDRADDRSQFSSGVISSLTGLSPVVVGVEQSLPLAVGQPSLKHRRSIHPRECTSEVDRLSSMGVQSGCTRQEEDGMRKEPCSYGYEHDWTPVGHAPITCLNCLDIAPWEDCLRASDWLRDHLLGGGAQVEGECNACPGCTDRARNRIEYMR